MIRVIPFTRTCYDGQCLSISHADGITVLNPDPLRARHISIRSCQQGWRPVFVDLDFQEVLALIHRIPRRKTKDSLLAVHPWPPGQRELVIWRLPWEVERKIGGDPSQASVYYDESEDWWSPTMSGVPFGVEPYISERNPYARKAERHFVLCQPPSGLQEEEDRLRWMLEGAAAEHFRRFVEAAGPAAFAQAARFGDLNWVLACLRTQDRAFSELITSNPGLGFWLATYALSETDDPTEVQATVARLATKRRRTIASHLGLSEDCTGILRRIHPRALTRTRLPGLRRGLCSPDVTKIIRHIPRINASVLELIGRPGVFALLAPSFLIEVAERKADLGVPHSAQRLLDTLEMMTKYAPHEIPKVFPTLSFLGNYHERFCARLTPDEREEILGFRLPKPPLSSDDETVIEPIRSANMLISESLVMENCLASAEFCQEVVDGELYFYRTLGTWGLDRTTFSVRRAWSSDWSRESIWILDHVEARRGRTPRGSTVKAIMDFLRRVQHLPDSEPVSCYSPGVAGPFDGEPI